MAYDMPEIGVYFTPDRPCLGPASKREVPFYGRLDKFNTIQWVVKGLPVRQLLHLPARSAGHPDRLPAPPANVAGEAGTTGEGVAGEALGEPVTGTRRIPAPDQAFVAVGHGLSGRFSCSRASQPCACSRGRVYPCRRSCANPADGSRIAHARRGVQSAPSSAGTTSSFVTRLC